MLRRAMNLALALMAAVYVFLATILLAKSITGNLWLAGYWIVLVPVAAIAGWRRLRGRYAFGGFVIFTMIQYVAVTIGSGASFSGSAQYSAWYTPVLTTLIFGSFLCLLNAAPMGVSYSVGTLLRRRSEARSLVK